MSSSSPDTDAAPPRLPPCMRMPNELLDEVFKQVFAELEHEPLRDRIRVYAPLSLVCRAWQRVAVTQAYANVVVDSVKLSASGPSTEAVPMGDQEEEDVEQAEGEDSDAPPFRPSPLLHGPADDDTSGLPIVASAARIFAECSNLSALILDQHFGSVLCQVTADHDPTFTWSKLTHLSLTWDDSFIIDLLPVLACLSHLQQLTSLCLLLGASNEHDGPRGPMSQELVDKYPVRPLERLQSLVVALMAEVPTGRKAVLQLISPHAPLQHVTWAGHIPPGLCKQLSYGTIEIKNLTFTWLQPALNLTTQLLPQLLQLGRRRVNFLTLNMRPVSAVSRTEPMPPITAVLQNLPCGIRLSSSTDMDPYSSGSDLPRDFLSGGADFAAIKARPTAVVTLGKEGGWSGSLNGKPFLQFGMFYVEKESDDDFHLRLFGRFGDPDVEGDVTEWVPLKMGFEEDELEE